jgi:hypothetical protein
MRLLFTSLTLLIFTSLSLSTPTGATDDDPPADTYLRADRLGITFISSGELDASDDRYARALDLGAGWNRWPLYWDRVEAATGSYDWSPYDRVVAADMRHGLRINAVLLGRPAVYADGDRIAGLNEPVFADGSDSIGPDKAINPDNPWAQFVYAAVRRYMPGGQLAQAEDWPADWGIRVWEIWNEPDFPPFWSGTVRDYARLLKVAYLAAHHADPEATVMFGGLIFNDPRGDNWLAQVLAIYQNDPFREEYNWYFDQVAVHNYNYSWRSGWLVLWVRQTLIAYDLMRPIWLNETGTPVWDDYPGPTWDGGEPERILRSTAEQQADFFIQSATYAWAEGAEVVFYHQLYDDCGNQPPGTTFPPHDGALCRFEEWCFGDAYGLFRNPADALCFNRHPRPDTARPVAAAYRLLADVFGTEPFENGRVQPLDPANAVVLTFDRPRSDERIFVIWNKRLTPYTIEIPAGGATARLLRRDAAPETRTASGGEFKLDLPPAHEDGYPALNFGDVSGVEGPPLILIQQGVDLNRPVPLPTPIPTATPPVTPSPEPTGTD